MFEILERCIDLCLVLHTVLNPVIGDRMGGKNVRTVSKFSVPNNWTTRPTKVGTIWFSPECILRSNFQRVNIWWKCLSLFSFWMTTSQGIFGGELVGLIFTTGTLHALTLAVFLPEEVILFTLITEVECSDFSWNAIPCVVWILLLNFLSSNQNCPSKNKLEHGFLVDLALTLKRLGDQFDSSPLWFFQKCIFQREGEALVFCDF